MFKEPAVFISILLELKRRRGGIPRDGPARGAFGGVVMAGLTHPLHLQGQWSDGRSVSLNP